MFNRQRPQRDAHEIGSCIMACTEISQNESRSFDSRNNVKHFKISLPLTATLSLHNGGICKLNRVVAAHDNPVQHSRAFKFLLTMSVVTHCGCWTVLQLREEL